MSVAARPYAPPPVPALRPRLANKQLLALFGVALAAVVGAAALAIALSGPGARPAPCPLDDPCGGPPAPPAPPLINQTPWRSADLGYQLEYDPAQWSKLSESGSTLQLKLVGDDLVLVIGGAPSAQASASSVAGSELDAIRGRVLSLSPDPAAENRILGPTVGYEPGVGGAYVATSNGNAGPGAPLWIAVMGATRGAVSAYAAVVTSESDSSARQNAYLAADEVLNTWTWPGG